MDSILKGYQYEQQVFKQLVTEGWDGFMWNNIPASLLIDLGVYANYQLRRKSRNIENGFRDTGCDLLMKSPTQKWTFVQCKNYIKPINMQDLAGFWYMKTMAPQLDGLIVSNSPLSKWLTIHNQLDKYKFQQLAYVEPVVIDPAGIEEAKGVEVDIEYELVHLRHYQRDAINACSQYQRSICSLPCGCGKTYVGIYWALRFQIVIIFSPLRAFAKQNLDRFQEVAPDRQYVLVDSDREGIRNIESLRHIIQTHGQIVLSVTYDSADVINAIMTDLQDKTVGIIIDEFHNLTEAQVIKNDDNPMFNILHNDHFNFLFLSATPRIFDIEDDDQQSYITGDVQYTMSFRAAINAGYICDYTVYIPSLLDKNIRIRDELYQEIRINDINKEYAIMGQFLIRGMDENGHSRCIAYFSTQQEAYEFAETVVQLSDFYGKQIIADVIISDTSIYERHRILSNFSNEQDVFHILCSVHILDECIDIPACDSIFLSKSTDNKIRTIQRICRSIRKHDMNPNKIAGIYFWIHETADIVDTIANLKEYDEGFGIEKVKLCNANENEKIIKKHDDAKDDDEIIEERDISNMIIGIHRVLTWSERYDYLQQYLLQNDNVYPTESLKQNKIANSLACWIVTQRISYRKQKLSEDKIHKLEMLNGWIWNILDEDWNAKYEQLRQYLLKNNNVYPIQNKQNEISNSFAVWIKGQRFLYNKQKLSNDRIRQLESLNGWKWNIRVREDWNVIYEKLQHYLLQNDNIYPTETSTNKSILSLAQWIYRQRISYKNHKLADDKIRLLELLNGWKWYVIEDWETIYEQLHQYLLQNNNIYPITNKKKRIDYSLARWITIQRMSYNKQKLSDDRIRLLESLNGWKWVGR